MIQLPFLVAPAIKYVLAGVGVLVCVAAIAGGGYRLGVKVQSAETAKVEMNLAHLQQAYTQETARQADLALKSVKRQKEITRETNIDAATRVAELERRLRNKSSGGGACPVPAVPGSAGGADEGAAQPELGTEGSAAVDALTIIMWQSWYEKARAEYERGE